MSSPAVRSLQSWGYRYKRTWRGSAVSSVLQPVLFLAAMGLGLGSLVNRAQPGRPALGGVTYLVFLAPALLAAAAMQTAAMESTWPVMAAVKWLKTYDAMLATPLRVRDVLTGHLTWIAMRVAMTCAVFLAVMAAFGAVKSPEAVLLLPVGILTGLAGAAPLESSSASSWCTGPCGSPSSPGSSSLSSTCCRSGSASASWSATSICTATP